MLKRMSMGGREDNYEHVLMCLICRSLFDDYDHQPKFLPCHHTFCKDCLREYVRQFGDEIECPSCRKVANIPTAGVTALQTNFYVKYIHSLVSGYGSGASTSVQQCSRHPAEKPHYFCRQCELSVCKQCCSQADCGSHEKIALTRATEESHQSLDKAFSAANSTIESKKVKFDKTLKALADEKDQALLNIDSTFDQHTHTIQRRATLLKNKVIAIYNEHKDKLENDLEEISTALTCIVSIKDYHEEMISLANFKDIPKGLEELEEVNRNISERIHPAENHIVFETNHGVERFKGSLRDLGRVRCSRPIAPRADPEGNAGEEDTSSQTPDTTPCMESKPFSSPEATSPLEGLQTPPEGAYAAYPPDVASDVTAKPPPGGHQQASSDKAKPEQQKSHGHVTKPSDSKQNKDHVKPRGVQVQEASSPRKTAQDVKPKGKTTAQGKQNHGELDANRNCQTQPADPSNTTIEVKPNPIAKLDLGRFSRGPSKSDKKSDRQNGNVIIPASKIPTKPPPGGSTSPSDTHRPGPGQSKSQCGKGQGTPSKMPKHGNSNKLDKIRAAHAQGTRHRMVQQPSGGGGGGGPLKPPQCSPTAGGGGTSIIAQAIAATSQDRQAKLPGGGGGGGATRPDTLLKPGTGHLPTVPAPAMPDLLPESVLKVMQSGTDDEKLRAEKEYYHLLYTSYDEEELLRELKSGAAPAPSVDAMGGGDDEEATPPAGLPPGWSRAEGVPPPPAQPWSRVGRTSLEDSDNSWLTTSSASEGASEESEGNNNDDNDILVAPQQTTV